MLLLRCSLLPCPPKKETPAAIAVVCLVSCRSRRADGRGGWHEATYQERMRGWATPGTSRGRTPAAEPQGGGDGQLRHAGGECRRRCARARYPSILSSLPAVDLSRAAPSCRCLFGSQLRRFEFHQNFILVDCLSGPLGSWFLGSPRITINTLSFCCGGFWINQCCDDLVAKLDFSGGGSVPCYYGKNGF